MKAFHALLTQLIGVSVGIIWLRSFWNVPHRVPIAVPAAPPIVAASEVVVDPNASVIAAVVMPYLVPLLLIALLWQIGRRAPSVTVAR